jgi:hypothetical protein
MNGLGKTARTIAKGAVALLSLLAAIVALVPAFKSIRRDTSDLVGYLWPDWIVAVLVLAVLGLLALLRNRERRLHVREIELRDVVTERDDAAAKVQAFEDALAPERREHDRRIIKQLIDVMPRQAIRFVAEHDFGGLWKLEEVLPVYRVANDLDDVEHRFLDPELESFRRAFIVAVQSFSTVLGNHSGPHERLADFMTPIPPLEGDMAPSGEAGDRWRQSKKLLNEGSTRVAETYDQLVGKANERLLL